MVPQLPGEHPDRQRQVPAQASQLAGGARARRQLCLAGQPGQQLRRLAGGQGIEADHRGVLQRGQPPAAGD
jgi:hypothetical protein